MVNETEKPELYVMRIEFLKDLRCFKEGFSIDFDAPMTVLVGENGSGKSTLMDLIRTEYIPNDKSFWAPHMLEGYAKVSGKKPTPKQVKHFDFHSGDMKFGTAFGDDMVGQISAQRASSGEGVLLQFGNTGMMKSERSLLLIDEVARGCSMNIQSKLAYGLYLSSTLRQNQVILTTHSEYIMKLSEMPECKLYSVEHRQYMSLKDFKKAHIKPFNV